MLPKKCLAFTLLIKVAVCQSVYPTTAVSYSTNSVPTIQTLPVSSTVSTIPSKVSATPATVSPISATVSPIPATATIPTLATVKAVSLGATPVAAKVTPMPSAPATAVKVSPIPTTITPLSSSTSPTVSSRSPLASQATISSTSISSSGKTEPKAYFLPAAIADPKVTILPHDTPTVVEVSCLYDDPYVVNLKDDGPMTPVKRVTMACADDFITPNEEPMCPGIPKKDIKPTPVLKKGNKGNLNNPIDFESLVDGFMSCL